MSSGAGEAPKTRARIGFDDLLEGTSETPKAAPDFDPAEWAPGSPPHPRPEAAATRAAADATGFRSREAAPEVKSAPPVRERAGGAAPLAVPVGPAPVAAPAPAVLPRRRRTGRNTQFNLKARPDIIARFCAVADGNDWGLGETLEYAVALLEREYGRDGPG